MECLIFVDGRLADCGESGACRYRAGGSWANSGSEGSVVIAWRREAEGKAQTLQPLVLPQAVLGLQGGRRRAPDIPPGLERKTHHPSLGSTTPVNLGLTGHPLPRQGPGKVCPPPGPVVWGPRGGWKPFLTPATSPPSRRDLWGAWRCPLSPSPNTPHPEWSPRCKDS